ncbi:unnamed protein product [Calicophoron daubneyi]|uniref:tRNA (cytosine(34)-C(5))-methyltransferase n=1 Tax=Calicophoron daubneyi TaxID=300641 RepID=A0AAV2TV36_CALDB
MARHRRPRCGRHQFTSETKRNKLFEQYYKGQAIVTEAEWTRFVDYLQKELPITFRITGFRDQNKELCRLIKHRYHDEVFKLKLPETDAEGQGHVAFESLPWYPDDMAWQLDTNRYVVRKTSELKKLHQFLVSEMESGNISRQEAVSMLPPLVMGIRQHHAILDMCAAPGSKAAQLVELLHADAESSLIRNSVQSQRYAEPTGLVIANDVEQKRCYMMVHQVKRLQSPCAVITQEDASCFPRLYVPVRTDTKDKPSEIEQLLFDRILADVPCSGDGTLRKNPDLWLRWTPNLGMAAHVLQLRILRRGLELLREPNSDLNDCARLVYSTCSFNPLENEAVIASMLQACQGAVRLVSADQLNFVDQSPTGPNNDTNKMRKSFIVRPGLLTWRVMDKSGQWFERFEDVPERLQSNIRPSLFPPDNVKDLHLERCMRVLPQDQNTGGFFLAVLEKVAPLPWLNNAHHRPIPISSFDSGVADKHIHATNTEPESEPPSGPKKPRIFHENPFTYIESSTDSDWQAIRKYYGILESGEENTNNQRLFCPEQLLYRSQEKDSRRRILYYTNPLVKDVIQFNFNKGVKLINSGVRMFALMEDKQFTGYRLLQDGADLADAFLPQDGGRRIHLTSDHYSDLALLLEEEMPLVSHMSSSTQAQWEKLSPGPVLVDYSPTTSLDPSSDLPRCRLVFAGWRGIKSLRHYIGRHERLHLMRMINLDPKPPIPRQVGAGLTEPDAPCSPESPDSDVAADEAGTTDPLTSGAL